MNGCLRGMIVNICRPVSLILPLCLGLIFFPIGSRAQDEGAGAEIAATVDSILARIEAEPHLITPGHIADLEARIDAATGERQLALLSWRAFYIDEFSETDKAIAMNQRLASLAEAYGNERYQKIAKLERTYLEIQHAEPETALARMEATLQEALEFGDPHVLANTYVDYSYTAASAGQTNFAFEMLNQALGLLSEGPAFSDWQRMELYGALIFAGSSAGDEQIILDSLVRLLDTAERLDVRIAGDIEAFNLARVLENQEKYELANEIFSRLYNLVSATPETDPLDSYFMLVGLAATEQALGNNARAIGLGRLALDDYEGHPVFDSRVYLSIARAYSELSQPAAAQEALEAARAILEDRQSFRGSWMEMAYLRARVDVLESAGRYREALETFEAYDAARFRLLEDNYDRDLAGVRATLASELERQRIATELAQTRLLSEMRYDRLLMIILAVSLLALSAQIYSARKLKESRRRAEEANKAKSQFLANISHELRTPLNAIIGFSEVILNKTFGPLGDKRYEDYMGDIRRSGRHLLQIIEEILDLSRIEAGKVQLHEETFTLDDVLEESISLVRHTARKNGIDLVFEPAGAETRIHADRRLIKQALLNLASNALKFTPSGGSVRIYTEEGDKGGLDIIVQDTGIGMSKDELEVAKSYFGQVESILSRAHAGTGLGIPLVHGFMILHDGDIVFTSEKGKGTTVRLCLPPERVEHPEKAESDTGNKAKAAYA